MGMSLRIYLGYPEWHQSATPESDIRWWHQRVTPGSDTRESNKRAWHQKVTPDCCLLMLIDANWCWLMLINAHIWFTRFSYVGAYLPSFFDHFLASQELCAIFWVFIEPALKITIVKVYGLLHALSCRISWSPIRSKRYVASVTRCNLHLSLPLKASGMRGGSQSWEETKVNMNKILLLCLLAGVLHALPSKYLKILPDLIIPKICKKK